MHASSCARARTRKADKMTTESKKDGAFLAFQFPCGSPFLVVESFRGSQIMKQKRDLQSPRPGAEFRRVGLKLWDIIISNLFFAIFFQLRAYLY